MTCSGLPLSNGKKRRGDCYAILLDSQSVRYQSQARGKQSLLAIRVGKNLQVATCREWKCFTQPMIDSLSNLLFGCRHSRTSFPHTPASGCAASPEDMYVVCLECGKQFHYDWERMRIGRLVGAAPRKRSNLRYFLTACALPLIWIAGKVAFNRKRHKPEKEKNTEP